VAKVGFDAMMKGEGDVVSGWKNKIESAIANVTPAFRFLSLVENYVDFTGSIGPRSDKVWQQVRRGVGEKIGFPLSPPYSILNKDCD
jgi:hypothetical protein